MMRNRRAFTLAEIITVMAILVIMTALIIGAVTKVRSSAREQQTRVILNVLKAVADEYEIQAGGKKIPDLDGRGDGVTFLPIDWTQPKAKNADGATGSGIVDDTIERFIWIVIQNDETGNLINTIGDDYVFDIDGDGFIEVADAYEAQAAERQQVVYSAEVAHSPQDTVYTQDDYLPEHQRPFFASRGKDNTWGTDDDVFSFDMD